MNVQILIGDCRDVLKTIADGTVDCIVTDPPYGETGLAWDAAAVWGWQQEAIRVLAPHGSMWIFGSFKFLASATLALKEWTVSQDLIWEKHNGSSLRRDRFRRVHEMAVQFYPTARKWSDVYKQPLFTNDAVAKCVRRKSRPAHWGRIDEGVYTSKEGGPRLMRSVMFCRSEHGRAVHPTQKPVACVSPLIEYSCPAGGLVLDPFAGSGTTGIAARQLGRRAILIEKDVNYARLAQERVSLDAPLLQSMESLLV